MVDAHASPGPTLTLIRDKKGHLFGGYAADAWSKHGVFYGSSVSFIFGLLPKTVKFTATGANANMLWCGQGFTQISNGLGWGGQVSADMHACMQKTSVPLCYMTACVHGTSCATVRTGCICKV